jgi:type IV secretion system protein VirD4
MARSVDPVAAFPRGLPDGDRNKPRGTGRWIASTAGVDLTGQWKPGQFLLGRDAAGRYAGVDDDRHILTVAGSRAGKGTSLIVPNLLHWPHSVLAIDPKGELATITASRRGHGSKWSNGMNGEVYVLDPFRRVTGPANAYAKASFNPLKSLDPDTDAGLEQAGMIADALIIQAKGDGAHWTQSARAFIRGLILFCAKTQGEDAHLIRLRGLLMQSRDDFNAMLDAMHDLGGVIGHAGLSMIGKGETEKWSVLSTCQVHTDFLEGGAMASVLTESTFSLDDLKKKPISVYLCLPATRLGTHGRWLRMMIAVALDAIERSGQIVPGQHPVLLVLDEFSALERMEMIERAAGQIAAYGAKLWPVVQDLTQLQRDYETAWETFMGNAGLLTFHGNTDLTTLDHISKRLGVSEVVRMQGGTTNGWQSSSGTSGPNMLAQLMQQGQQSQSSGTTQAGGQSHTESVMQAPLMQPDEVARCFARDVGNLLAFIARSDVPPLALYRCSYFSGADDALFGGLYDPAPGFPAPPTLEQRKTGRKASPG